MLSLKLDEKDLVLDSLNEFEYINDVDELIQSFRLLIETNLKEWFLNENMGFDYEELKKKQYDEDLIRFALIECLDQDPRFEELLEFNLSINKSIRSANITFKARVDGIDIGMSIESEVG